MTISECVQRCLQGNGGAAACYLGPPSPSGTRALCVTRPRGPPFGQDGPEKRWGL